MEYSTLIMGSMYSGKSEELKRLIKRSEIAGKKCQLFKPLIDNRYSADQILTHDAAKLVEGIEDEQLKKIIINNIGTPAIPVSTSEELFNLVEDDTQIVGIDEIQFFDENIIMIIEKLNKRNIRVIMSGLDMYSSGDPFPVVATLACKCKYVEKVHAVCIDCGIDAAYSHKIEDKKGNKVASVDIGSEGKYIALCEKCRMKHINKRK
jgi:thymidine kinase